MLQLLVKLSLLIIFQLIVGMPNLPYLYATDFIHTLKKKHKSGSYKEMVINAFGLHFS